MINIIPVYGGVSTAETLSRVLDGIESATGYRPFDWMREIYDDAIAEYRQGDLFDFEGFAMSLNCFADHFIDFIRYRSLNMAV